MKQSIWNSEFTKPSIYSNIKNTPGKIKETADVIYGRLKGYYNSIGNIQTAEEERITEILYYNIHGITPSFDSLRHYIIQNDNAVKKNIEQIFILRINRYGRQDKYTKKRENIFIDINRAIAFLYSLLLEKYPDFTNYGIITDEDLIQYINTGEMPYDLPKQTEWGTL